LETIAAPATFRIAYLKWAEQEDFYDIETNFTLFSLQV
jgi:hypothetical protein